MLPALNPGRGDKGAFILLKYLCIVMGSVVPQIKLMILKTILLDGFLYITPPFIIFST